MKAERLSGGLALFFL